MGRETYQSLVTNAQKIVVKVGTSTLTHKNGSIIHRKHHQDTKRQQDRGFYDCKTALVRSQIFRVAHGIMLPSILMFGSQRTVSISRQ